mmetsp:Transcript_37790/g.119212  ORF Transcript_37790/g.119212 Transcript_37790/m.119212 type:complete len:245 (+) Transcript_37790:1-735(+)
MCSFSLLGPPPPSLACAADQVGQQPGGDVRGNPGDDRARGGHHGLPQPPSQPGADLRPRAGRCREEDVPGDGAPLPREPHPRAAQEGQRALDHEEGHPGGANLRRHGGIGIRKDRSRGPRLPQRAGTVAGPAGGQGGGLRALQDQHALLRREPRQDPLPLERPRGDRKGQVLGEERRLGLRGDPLGDLHQREDPVRLRADEQGGGEPGVGRGAPGAARGGGQVRGLHAGRHMVHPPGLLQVPRG